MLLWIEEFNKTMDKDLKIHTSLEIEKTNRLGLGMIVHVLMFG